MKTFYTIAIFVLACSWSFSQSLSNDIFPDPTDVSTKFFKSNKNLSANSVDSFLIWVVFPVYILFHTTGHLVI